MLNYSLYGNSGAPAVCLIHGYGETSIVWTSLVESLENSYRVLVIDLPGFLNSPLTEANSLAQMAEDIHVVLEKEDMSQAVLLGHSMGGYIGLEFCAKFPESVKGFGMIHSTANADSVEKSQGRRKTIDFLRKSPLESYAKLFAPNLFAEQNRSNQEWIKAAFDSAMGCTNEGLINAMEAMISRTDNNKVYSDLDIPYLFVVGRYDEMVPMSDMLKQAASCRRSMSEIFNESGHLAMVEEELKLKKVVKDYLNWVYRD